jgi:hypothetical protein
MKFVWLEGFKFSNNICCNLHFAPWKFPINLVELAFKMLRITISKSPSLLFGDTISIQVSHINETKNPILKIRPPRIRAGLNFKN